WQALQNWFVSQAGDRRARADYWAANRNRLGHLPCPDAAENYSGEKSAFVAGCQEAKQRLDPLDARRQGEPQYRAGFNDAAKRMPITPLFRITGRDDIAKHPTS